MTIYSGFSHQKWWFSIVMLNYQRVGDSLSAGKKHEGNGKKRLRSGLGNCAATAPRHGSMTSKSSCIGWWRGWAASHSTPLNEIKRTTLKMDSSKNGSPKKSKASLLVYDWCPTWYSAAEDCNRCSWKIIGMCQWVLKKDEKAYPQISDLNYTVL